MSEFAPQSDQLLSHIMNDPVQAHWRLIEEIDDIEEERLVPSSPDGASSLQEDAALDPAPSIKVS